jgi:hypothetical protein
VKRIQSSRSLAITASVVLGLAGFACTPADESMEIPAVEAAVPGEAAAPSEEAVPGEVPETAPLAPETPEVDEEPEAEEE